MVLGSRQFRRFHRILSAGFAAVLVAFGLSACSGSSSTPEATLAAYLAAWSHQEWQAMARLVDRPPADFVKVNRSAWSDLGVQSVSFAHSAINASANSRSTELTSRLDLAGFGPLELHSTVRLADVAGRWLVDWSPATISDQLASGDSFLVGRSWPARAEVLGAGGASLTPTGTVVTVGLVGQRFGADTTALTRGLTAAGFDATSVATAVVQAEKQPTQFTPLATIAQARYQTIKPAIYPLAGTAFESNQQQGTLTPDLAAHVVGHVGPITADELKQLGPPYTASSQVGQNGIEQVYEKRLAGTPTTTVEVVDPTGRVVTTLATRTGTSGQPVQTSIDPKVQAAVESALDGVSQQAAIVVLRASTGEVLASVSRPTSQAFDVALDASVAPGSTFKVVTTTALLQAGLTPATPATCPPSVVVDGKPFVNYEHESVASLSLEQAFAMSCNTAFVGLARDHLDGAKLAGAAQFYGIGTPIHMGLPANSGSAPAATTAVDLAAEAIGQGQVTVSPLAMAAVAAAVDSGSLHEPRLVGGAADDTAVPTMLDPGVDSALKALMAQVVSSPDGTASGAGLPAGTYGKTGTAEFGSGANPAEHAWFIGFRGDVAFAVFVYGGGVGGTVAAPIAAKFLRTLGTYH
jgi:hypothetical protein